MTYSGELNNNSAMGADNAQNYPQVFGITLTPIVSGISCTVLGVLGAGYILMSMAMPVWNDYQKIGTDRATKQSELDRLKNGNVDKIVADLNVQLKQKNGLKSQMMGLFADQKDLDTLLLDINSFVVTNQAKLVQFTPDKETTVIQDNSFGTAVDGKLKRQTYNVIIEGTFPQIQAIFSNLERLEPLLAVRDFKSEPVDTQVLALLPTKGNQGQIIPVTKMKVKTEFKLDAIIPLTPEEIEKLKPKPVEVPAAKAPAAKPDAKKK
jgi:hypothetical protein